jgi:HK97 family phage major capsid protein
MTTGQPNSVSDFVKLSQAAILAGDLDQAETYKNQAFALKGLDELTPKVDPSARPAFGSAEPDTATQEANANSAAMKAWYTKSTGGADIDGDIETVLNDMYGNYRRARWAKAADFTRFIRSGSYDPQLKSLVVYTPEQIMMELAAGLTVSDIKAAQKATQVESQDTSGGYLVPEDFRDSVVTRLQGMTQMRSVAETITTASDRVTMPVSDGGDDRYTGSVRVFKVDESPTKHTGRHERAVQSNHHPGVHHHGACGRVKEPDR